MANATKTTVKVAEYRRAIDRVHQWLTSAKSASRMVGEWSTEIERALRAAQDLGGLHCARATADDRSRALRAIGAVREHIASRLDGLQDQIVDAHV